MKKFLGKKKLRNDLTPSPLSSPPNRGRGKGEGVKLESHSPEMTLEIAKGFAQKLKAGTVIALSGNLGSGKTTFIKGIALGLGLRNPDEVKSPTFALMHIYPTRIPLQHFDLYRLDKLEEIRNIGLEEFAANSNAVTCIEWAEKASSLLPFSTLRVILEMTGSHTRRVTIRPLRKK